MGGDDLVLWWGGSGVPRGREFGVYCVKDPGIGDDVEEGGADGGGGGVGAGDELHDYFGFGFGLGEAVGYE